MKTNIIFNTEVRGKTMSLYWHRIHKIKEIKVNMWFFTKYGVEKWCASDFYWLG